MVVILSCYVFMNPGMLSIQDSSMVPTYSGDLDVSTTYYVTSGGGGSISFTSGAGGSGVMDDIQTYNYKISKDELNYLYDTEPESYYKFDSTDSSNWDVNNVPDGVVITDVIELEEPLATNIWDYLFK